MTWRLEAATGRQITGRFWRMLAPRWASQPLSGMGAARAGGRWNSAGRACLYLSEDHATAIAEYQQDLPRPGTLTAYDVEAAKIIDLTNPAIRAAVGVSDALLRLAWKHVRDVEHGQPESWAFADAASAAGWSGLLVPSVQVPGRNLVLWDWSGNGAVKVVAIDPLGDLPRNQASWA